MKGVLPDSILSDQKRGFNLPIKAWTKEFLCAPNSEYIDRDRTRRHRFIYNIISGQSD